MSTLTQLIEWLHPATAKRPDVRVGATVRVYQKIVEGEKERLQVYEGLVIKKTGSKPDIMITVRRVVDGIGIEKIIPLMSKNVEKIDIVKEAKVRRAKLYHMRGLRGKSARLNETYLTDNQRKDIMTSQSEEEVKAEEATEAPVAEAPKAEEAKVEAKAE